MRRSPRYPWEDAYPVIEPQITADSVHVWPFRPEFPVDVRFLRFAPKHDIRMNRHEYFEILYVFSGAVTYQVHERLHPVGSGDLFVMGSTLLHGIQRYDTPGMKAAVLYFHRDAIAGGEAQEGMQYLMPFLVQDETFPHVVPASSGVPRGVFDLMLRAQAELPALSTRGRLTVRTYLRMMLVLLVNHFAAWRGSEDVFERQQRGLEKLAPLFAHIGRCYWQPISIEDAADLVHMSRSSFSRFFREVTGQSFVGYLNRFRIAKAEALLLETDLSIAEVGQKVGFSDQSYFGLMFRNCLQLTPKEYKQRAAAAR